MAYPIVRMFESEQQARDAASKLRDAGFYEDVTFVVTPPGEGEGASADMLGSAILAGRTMGDQAAFYADRLKSGRTLVVVAAPPGMGRMAGGIMDSCGPVDTEMRAPVEPDAWGSGAPLSSAFYLPVLNGGPAPFSRVFGLPMLTHGQSTFGTLTNPHWTFSRMFGLKILTKVAAPLSAVTGMPMRVRAAAPLSAMLGLPRLGGSAAPLSSTFGIPLLSRNGAPLSSLFSLPLLAQPR